MKAHMSRGAAMTVLALLGIVGAGAGSAHAQGVDDIYAKAKGEGAVVLYVGGPTAP